jgi:hypothetical protein
MAQVRKLRGDEVNLIEFEEFIIQKFHQQVPIKKIAKVLGVTYNRVNSILSKYMINYKKDTITLGHKNIPYYTEEELLNPPRYSWETLTHTERNFYNSYTNKLIEDGRKK